MGKGYSPEQIIKKLRQAEAKLSTGATIPEVARGLGVSEATFHRWRKRCAGCQRREHETRPRLLLVSS
jgi:putative transposase